jgi:hypothetical protein
MYIYPLSKIHYTSLHHHQPINAPSAGAQAFLMGYIYRNLHN